MKFRFLVRTALVALLATALGSSANAIVIGGTVTGGDAFIAGGAFVKLTVPLSGSTPVNSVGNNTFQSPNLYAFDEDQNILLAAALNVDVGASPIAAGATVASHYVFFDPNPTQSIIGTVDFDSNVLAIITSTGLLAASDFLANTGVNYLNPTLRGLEAGDAVTISGLKQIMFNVTASTPGDYVRVLTEYSPGAEVPLPAALPLFATGLGVMGLLSWRRKRKASAIGATA